MCKYSSQNIHFSVFNYSLSTGLTCSWVTSCDRLLFYWWHFWVISTSHLLQLALHQYICMHLLIREKQYNVMCRHKERWCDKCLAYLHTHAHKIRTDEQTQIHIQRTLLQMKLFFSAYLCTDYRKNLSLSHNIPICHKCCASNIFIMISLCSAPHKKEK